ncbi:MAG: hypothetical protein ACP5LW_06385 [Nitrososphaeria archaeon]|jgi:molybdopterin converting factor small subunit
MPHVRGYSIIQKYLGKGEVFINASTLKELLLELKKLGIDIESRGRSFYLMDKPIIIYVNGKEATDIEQRLSDDEPVMIFPLIDGGLWEKALMR